MHCLYSPHALPDVPEDSDKMAYELFTAPAWCEYPEFYHYVYHNAFPLFKIDTITKDSCMECRYFVKTSHNVEL